MGFLDRLLGREDRSGSDRSTAYGQPRPVQPQPTYRTDYPTPGQPSVGQQQAAGPRQPLSEDERALERYRYLLRTAPPDQLEQAHAEAFAKLTPQQRQQVLSELSQHVPPAERAPSDSPQDLARMATRAEVRQPGTLERSFSGAGGPGGSGGGRGLGMGAVIGGGLLAGVAGAFVGTAIADAMFDGSEGDAYAQGFQDAQEDMAADAGYDGGGFDGGGFDGGDDFGGDFGGDFDV
ncbi:hypothetical protein SAMN06264364_102207 [Quadrisphaera granulorum]|uniref:DUF2076 domain-containing protein n=1 Tax=Quadrisphaera granulorum TaxID=317664 RepID=A0A316ADZ6_9ACTN|nr:hypothetical protein [Quadrisphaera granulorum]PWJ55841.1 hypothetical protein BXY45_102207 [Quadrisphaera granulorum]SZE95338.1 hypothetical protein SAMN06264364_102207 [Quadrisphaera granulorum]